jgi:TolB-like protein/Tfp pilus assembly protein PilF
MSDDNNSGYGKRILVIGAFQVDAQRNRILRGQKPFTLEPQIMDVLCVLAGKPGEVISRDDLIEQVWNVQFGGDESLTRAISILRKTFKKAGEDDLYIETIYKRGYRLKAPVSKPVSKNQTDLTGTRPDKEISIAVLAFEDMSCTKDQEYFSDGISEEIINALVKIPYLRVTGRTSSFSFKGKKVPIREIASTLNVTHILEGSVRKTGEHLRITVQLIDGAVDAHIWSETFDGTLDDIFDLQEKIARATERQLSLVFDTQDVALPQRLAGTLTASQDAYAFFVQGRSLTHQQDGQDTLPRAIEFFEKAVAFDPKFAEAWACLAIANFYLLEHSTTPNWHEKISAGRRAAGRALDLNPDITLVYSTLGYLALFDLELNTLVEVCAKVHELEPASHAYEYAYGNALASIGQSERGMTMMERAISREPLSASWINGIGHPKFALEDFDGANAKYQQSLDMGYDSAMFMKAILLKHTQNSKTAISFLQENLKHMGSFLKSAMPNKFVLNLSIDASYGTNRLTRWLAYMALNREVGNKKTQPTVGLSFRCYTLGYPRLFMKAVRRHPSPYLGASLAQLWTPTVEAKRIRTHKGFPKFAQDIGLVRAWQANGWPKTIQPIDGTDGSEGQFTCS